MTKVLLVEDDTNLGGLLCDYLNMKGFKTDLFSDGIKGYESFMKNQYDICLLDIMMPFKDGFTLAGEIRMVNSGIPIIFLTAKSMKEDIIEGFRIGADDYLKKPFSMEELIARMEAILRRSKKNESMVDSPVFNLGRFEFNSHKQLLSNNDKVIKLTTKESELLKMLCINMNQLLNRETALQAIWKNDSYFNARSMDVYITKLRKLLKEEPRLEIINIHGTGYKLIFT
ncbi:MAG: response regulator transcription factor [Bacteroidia bacterium]|nr:response regulator transcription factor [Bacteroidia bacterium]